MRDVFVPPAWVDDHPEAVVVDVRDGWEYEGIGHVPRAVNVPFDSFRSDDGEVGKLPPREHWEALLGEAGVAPDDDVVAYDDTHGVFAARFVVTALLLGHEPETLHVLDGDYSAWERERETTTEAPGVDTTDYVAAPPETTPLVSFEQFAELVAGAEGASGAAEDDAARTEAVLVDTREPWEFAEGHVPGAVQLDWRELVDEESRGLLPESDLRRVLEANGVTPDRRVVLYCNTARRISHTYLVLRHLGYEDVLFYEGSLTEWEARGGEVVADDAEE